MERLPVRGPLTSGPARTACTPTSPSFWPILRDQPIKLTMTSNGFSVAAVPDADLAAFKDIEFSLDYPTEAEQDAQRGAGNWALIHEQAARCRRLGVPVTFIAVMMQSNFDRLADIAAIAKTFDAALRINVYQSVRTDKFAFTYEQYWSAFELLFSKTDVVAVGEPLVRAMAGMPARKGGCGVGTVRVTPRATVQPCVYWPGKGEPLDVLLDVGPGVLDSQPFVDARSVPKACEGCAYLDACRGGCAGRRRLMGALDEPDPYCPVVRDNPIRLHARFAETREMPKLESACTTIVMAR